MAAHGLAFWLLSTQFTSPRAEVPAAEIQMALVRLPAMVHPISAPPPAPNFISPTTNEVIEPEIDIETSPSNGPAVSTTAEATIIPPRPDPAFINRNPALPPRYQTAAKRYEVDLLVRIETDGHVASTKVSRSCGDTILDRLAEQFAAANWRFRPALQNGLAMAEWTTVLVTFQQMN